MKFCKIKSYNKDYCAPTLVTPLFVINVEDHLIKIINFWTNKEMKDVESKFNKISL